MPNWVYNKIEGYTPEMFEKYKEVRTNSKGEEVVEAISFQNIIPMPKEFLDIPAGSLANYATMLYDYEQYKANTPENERSRWDNIEISTFMKNQRESLYSRCGKFAIENPDKTLNEILNDGNHEYDLTELEIMKESTGNDKCLFPGEEIKHDDPNRPDNETLINQRIEMLDRYSERLNKRYITEKEKEKNSNKNPVFKHYNYPFDSLTEMGKAITECKEKYGAKDWYTWRCAHWGTKWDASDIEYDEEEQTVRFDTAWAPPEPVLAKIQEDFPDAKFNIYAEEESGWFNEYETKEDGKIHRTIEGEYKWKEDENGDWIEDGTDEKEVDIVLTTDPDTVMSDLLDNIK